MSRVTRANVAFTFAARKPLPNYSLVESPPPRSILRLDQIGSPSCNNAAGGRLSRALGYGQNGQNRGHHRLLGLRLAAAKEYAQTRSIIGDSAPRSTG